MDKFEGSLLVVDDSEMNRDMLTRRLVRWGYTVAAAENGRRALDMIAAQTFDLIVLDIMMPGLSRPHCRRRETGCSHGQVRSTGFDPHGYELTGTRWLGGIASA